MIAASSSNRQIGWIVISTTLSTILMQSKKFIPSHAFLNSGRYQPAYLIAQTGIQGSFFPSTDSKISLFQRTGNSNG